MNEDVPDHTCKGTGGVCALGPEGLNIELRWATWSPTMLSDFDLTRLRSLKMPVRVPLDYLRIGAAFMGMPPDNYTVVGIRSNFLNTRFDITSFAVKEAAPHLGPGTK